jgi:hypothetical protein
MGLACADLVAPLRNLSEMIDERLQLGPLGGECFAVQDGRRGALSHLTTGRLRHRQSPHWLQ